MREDSKYFLKKILGYRQVVGKDSFVINYQYFKEIPNVESGIFDIINELIDNNCLAKDSKVIDLVGDIFLNLTLVGINYFSKTELKPSKQTSLNIFAEQVNLACDNGSISACINNEKNNVDESEKSNNFKFLNNKKQEYINDWHKRLFLHLNENKKPITLEKAFIMPEFEMEKKYSKIKIYEDDPLDKVIKKFTELRKTSTLLITGVPGIGKTSIVSWIANEYENSDNLLILRFRNWESEELEKGLLNAVCNTFRCGKRELERKVLILDGFDEIKVLNEKEKILNMFMNEIKDIKHFKCIITSRDNYINSNYFQIVLTILPFDLDRIKEFYCIITGEKLYKDKWDCENRDVLGIPVILYMAIMTKIDITKKSTKPELYNLVFAEKGGIFDRFFNGDSEYDEGSHIFRNAENIKIYLRFLRKIAFCMFEKNSLSLEKGEFKKPKLDFLGNNTSVLEFPIKILFENYEANFDIEFIHKSIYEYFLSEYIFMKILKSKDLYKKDMAEVLGNIFKNRKLSKEVLEFLKYKINNSILKYEFDNLEETFQLMLQDGMTYYTGKCYKNVIDCEVCVFANMLEILHLWEEDCVGLILSSTRILKCCNDFELNLSSLNFVGADLVMADLSDANLQGADLQGARLRYANLDSADLRHARLRNSDFLSANLRNANIDGAEISENDVESLESKGDLSNIRVCLNKTKKVVSYEKYCKIREKRDELTAVGIDFYVFDRKGDNEKIKILKEKGLDPAEFDILL